MCVCLELEKDFLASMSLEKKSPSPDGLFFFIFEHFLSPLRINIKKKERGFE